MHIYTLAEVCHATARLMDEGMGLGHAVRLSSAAYGFTEDQIYSYMTKNNIGGQAIDRD